jgi:3-oxoadipate enol-lactonase
MIGRARTLLVTVVATTAPAVAGVATNPMIRGKAQRVGRLTRPLGVVRLARPAQAGQPARVARRSAALAPMPPRLPPGRVMNLPGRGEVFARDSGGTPAGPAVLLLHGWTASADLNFFPVYARLAEAYRVIAMDLRGHGRGMRSAEPFSLEDCADDADALLDQLGAGPVSVVGYSMGGPVGLLLARRHPGRVRALVMQATALEWHDTARERMVWRLLPLLELGLRLGTGAGLVERVLRQAIEESPELDVYRPWLAAEFRRGLARELAEAGYALSRYDARPWAGQLGLPAAMVITTRDRLVRPAKQRELAEALHAEVIEIDADHDLPLTRGGDYARLTRLAVDNAAAAAGLRGPARSPARPSGSRRSAAAALQERTVARPGAAAPRG